MKGPVKVFTNYELLIWVINNLLTETQLDVTVLGLNNGVTFRLWKEDTND